MVLDPPEPLGFPKCPNCFYLQQGSPGLCLVCASGTLAHLPPPHCDICSQSLQADRRCSNGICRDPRRSIDQIRALAAYSEPLKTSILRLKGGRRPGWAGIFGRLLLGYLEVRSTEDLHPDVIVILPNPTYGGSGHTELVIEAAEREDIFMEWNFRPRGLRLKAHPEPHGNTFEEKRAAADALGALLELEQSLEVVGRHVLVYDDVCTTGLQLDRIARFLKAKGAVRVEAVVMARTGWAS